MILPNRLFGESKSDVLIQRKPVLLLGNRSNCNDRLKLIFLEAHDSYLASVSYIVNGSNSVQIMSQSMLGEIDPGSTNTAGLWFCHAANVLYVVCYAVKDVLWLRIFCVAAMLIIMPYFVLQHQYVPMWWNFGFLALNIFWIVVILRERMPPKMTDEQKRLYADVFKPSCSPQEMLKLLSVAETTDCKGGEMIIENQSSPNRLFLISKGRASVVVDKKLVASLSRGDFVGEMSYLTGEPAVADVEAASKMQYLSWDKEQLLKMLDGKPELKSAVNEIIGRDLIQKLGSQEVKVPELSVETVIMKK